MARARCAGTMRNEGHASTLSYSGNLSSVQVPGTDPDAGNSWAGRPGSGCPLLEAALGLSLSKMGATAWLGAKPGFARGGRTLPKINEITALYYFAKEHFNAGLPTIT